MGRGNCMYCIYSGHDPYYKNPSILKEKMKKAEIKITVELDDNNVPETMVWESTDSETKEQVAVKSMMLALWDHNYKNSLRIDLWTKDMPVDEMKRFFYETLQTMGDSFLKATGETLIVEDLRDYCAHFADKMGIKQP
jgi:gliding motility-associated protein GldC